jgi:hypothetical protein
MKPVASFEDAYKPSQATAEPATAGVIAGRLANVVPRLMIPPLILLAIGWAFAGFSRERG